MQSAPYGEILFQRLSGLVARSEINIRHSRALVAASGAIVQETHRIRRPRLAGGSDAPEAARAAIGSPRAMRTLVKTRSGGLPTADVRRRWVGPGRGERCNGCGDRIAPHESEFEVDFKNTLWLRFHDDCFNIWQIFGRKRPDP